jgi:streptogrisin B
MSIPRTLRRLAGSAALALALTAGTVVTTAAPAHAAAPPVGSTVCHVSPTAGLRCGTVTAVNVTVTFPGGVITGLFRYNVCPQPRDTGATVYVLPSGAPVGTVVGGGGCQTYAMPLS